MREAILQLRKYLLHGGLNLSTCAWQTGESLQCGQGLTLQQEDFRCIGDGGGPSQRGKRIHV